MAGCVTTGTKEASFTRSIYADMVMMSDARSARVSSWDRSGKNKDYLLIKPGETLELAAIRHAGTIRHIYFTILGPEADKPYYLQDLVLRMYWDGETTPSVEVPFGELFGQGHGRLNYFQSHMVTVNPGAQSMTDEASLTVGFNTYFPMPFDNGARITLTNDGPNIIDGIWYHIDHETCAPLGSSAGRFHAQYRQERPTHATGPESNANVCPGVGVNLDGAENYVILEAQGRGNAAGYFLNIDNLSSTWYGEGDDMIFIDGETWPPSIHGSGSEEIFGGGACPNRPYAGPYTGYLRVGGDKYHGEITAYRFYVPDPIHFQKSIRMTVEHGHANNFSNDYSSTVFWYQTEPHAAFPPLPSLRERLSRRMAVASKEVKPGQVVLPVTGQGAVQTGPWNGVRDRSGFHNTVFWTEPGDGSATCRWTFTGLKPGAYVVSVWVPNDPLPTMPRRPTTPFAQAIRPTRQLQTSLRMCKPGMRWARSPWPPRATSNWTIRAASASSRTRSCSNPRPEASRGIGRPQHREGCVTRFPSDTARPGYRHGYPGGVDASGTAGVG